MEVKTYSITELNVVFTLLSKAKNDKDLKEPSSMLSVIRIIKKIQDVLKTYTEEQKQILELFEVPQVEKEEGAVFDWSGMKPEIQSKINASLKELNDTKYEIKVFNKIDEEDFIILTKEFNAHDIAFLWSYLVKE